MSRCLFVNIRYLYLFLVGFLFTNIQCYYCRYPLFKPRFILSSVIIYNLFGKSLLIFTVTEFSNLHFAFEWWICIVVMKYQLLYCCRVLNCVWGIWNSVWKMSNNQWPLLKSICEQGLRLIVPLYAIVHPAQQLTLTATTRIAPLMFLIQPQLTAWTWQTDSDLNISTIRLVSWAPLLSAFDKHINIAKSLKIVKGEIRYVFRKSSRASMVPNYINKNFGNKLHQFTW